ncbi:nuclear transport factor 2 family protein [Actinomadura sp. 9N407]|uniref:nuclear transport factor 2 family protein n=1 Tax=Actinomadura sp. 9N407 TaxID=3375154 RepID=UPI0037AD9ED6
MQYRLGAISPERERQLRAERLARGTGPHADPAVGGRVAEANGSVETELVALDVLHHDGGLIDAGCQSNEQVELVQPLLGGASGRAQAVAEVRRLLAFLPDATGEVLDWAGAEDVVFIDLRITGTVGGKPLSFRTLDKLRIDRSGQIVRRDAFFDSVPLLLTLTRRPSAWLPWWRSGIGPLASRRRLLRN